MPCLMNHACKWLKVSPLRPSPNCPWSIPGDFFSEIPLWKQRKTYAIWFHFLQVGLMLVLDATVISRIRMCLSLLLWKVNPPTPIGSVPSLVRNVVRNSPAMFSLYALRSARTFDRGWEAFFLPETA